MTGFLGPVTTLSPCGATERIGFWRKKSDEWLLSVLGGEESHVVAGLDLAIYEA